MPLKYLDSGLSINGISNKQKYIDLFQETLNLQFSNASNVFTIQEETFFASGEYQDVEVRVNHVINTLTGKRLGDDYKELLFKDLDHSVSLGRLYQFDGSYWITTNIEVKKNLAASCTVRRCNNTLRWVDGAGGIYTEPCVIDYDIKENRDYSTAGSSLVIPSGIIDVTTQFNTYTNKIRPNQRFLFGNSQNWTAYKLLGGGINNFNNLQTVDNASPQLLRMTMNANYVNDSTDDLTNGIADFNQNNYVISISKDVATGNIGQQIQLSATIEYNGQTSTRTLVWESDLEEVATVDSNGLVSLIDVGTCIITCSLLDNPNVKDTASITVTVAPIADYHIIMTPDVNYILEGETVSFDVGLYLNGTRQPDTFSFSLNAGTTPSTNYAFTPLDGNTFQIVNYKYWLDNPLYITCTSGTNSRIVDITLRGSW